MLNCRDLSDRASDVLDGILSFHARLQVSLHVLMCRLCREYIRQMALVSRTLRRLPSEKPPVRMQEDLLAAFRRHTAGGGLPL